MKRNWIKRMAVLLSLCLILNSGFLDLAGYVYAASGDVVQNSTVQTVEAGNVDTITDTTNTDNTPEPANDGSDVIPDNTDGNSENNNGNTENNGDNTNNNGNDEATTTTETNASTESNTTETGSDSEDTERDSSDIDSTDEMVTDTTTETETTETETTEEETTEDAPVMMMMSARAVEESVPSNVDTYLAQVAAGKTEFYIKTTQDFINVQELCKDSRVNGFAGITFKISYPEDVSDSTQQYWDTSQMTGFTGIGSSAAPFKGTMESAFDDYASENSSTYLRLDRPLFSRLGDGATFRKIKIVANGCSSPIAEYIDRGNITLSDLRISGTIGKGAATYEAGTIAAILLPNAKITISNVSSTANVTAGYAGAIAGRCYSTANITWPNGYVIGSSSTSITVTGTNGAGGLYGYAAAAHTVDLKYFEHISVNVNGNGGYAGQLIGYLDGTEYATNVTVMGGNSITAKVGTTNGTTAGGLIGAAVKATLTLPEGEFTVNGKVDGGTHVAGGLIGVVTYSNMTIENVTIAENAEINANLIGGIIGRFGAASALATVDKSRMIINTPTVNGKLTATSGIGGILGWVDIGCAVELQGTVTVADNMSGTDAIGAVAAKQDSALIYLHGIEGKNTDGASQLDVPLVASSLPKYNDVYTYGGVFRNQDMGNGVLLIGDGTLANVGVVNNSITGGKLGENGTIDAVADLETFAIANFSNGEFGLTGVFTDASSTADILADDYVLYNNADISYEKTGIITLNRNDVEDNNANKQYAFSGTLAGVNKDITITQNTYLFQKRMGLFSGLAGTPEFSNLIIKGNVTRSTYVGGLAYWISGEGIKLTDVQMYKDFSSLSGSIGGFIVREIGSSLFTVEANNVVLASKINAGSISDFSGFINNMDYATVNMTDITMGGKLSSFGSTTAGGFLGYKWTNTGGMIQDVTVPGGATYSTNAQFGCMLYQASTQEDCGRLILEDVNLSGLNVTADAGVPYTSLLIYNGTDLVLEVIDYSASGATVTNAPTTFDEIMGNNFIDKYGLTFGIVSIHNSTKSFPEYHYDLNFTDTTRHATYVNTTPTMNDNSRYYYDVFQHLDAEILQAGDLFTKEDSYYVIDSPAKYLLWDILNCCELRSHMTGIFKKYFEKENIISSRWAQKCYFDGDNGPIDLTNYSVYPVPKLDSTGTDSKGNPYTTEFIGRNDAKIIFAADGMQDWELPNNEKSQHLMLHAGILYNTYKGKIIFEDLTLAGSIACYDSDHCGVLVSGSLNANAEITNVTLDNLYISGYGDDADINGACLLIAEIPAGTSTTDAIKTVKFDGVRMINYTENTGYVGASLIHYAGHENGTNLVLRFHDMAIEHNKQTDSKYGTVLKYSSFLYDYYYTDDASINKGSGIYLFSKQDTLDNPRNVTYGAELDYETEYSDSSETVFKEGVDLLPETKYIPYVYIRDTNSTEKQIEVNPKSGDILKGCGTYEDPYIIETSKQFLTLYRYINEPVKEENEEYKNQTFYEDWKVIITGDDSTFCNAKHNVTIAEGEVTETDPAKIRVSTDGKYTFVGTGASDARVFGEEGFPTPDQMSQAYYQLGADIVLAGITNSTYSGIAEEFVGFGTKERPFTGVWYGKDPVDSGVIHTITLPDKKQDASYTTYGFIQYAQGAVVKDIELTISDEAKAGAATINTAEVSDILPTKVTTAYGSVIAVIMGGDNIIDNVISSVYIRTAGPSYIGGYVGNVQKGGLILRNVETADISNFKIYQDHWKADHYWGSLVGRVEDGYIIYEGDTSGSIFFELPILELVKGPTSTETESIETVENYHILNGNTLRDNVSGADITIDKTNKNITITIPSAAALQVMEMAMNSDALNVCPSDHKGYMITQQDLRYQFWGYSEKTRSRKAAYSSIGKCAEDTPDYLYAVKYDNVTGYTDGDYSSDRAYAYPYLYQYMGVTGTEYLDFVDGTTSGYYSVLNLAQTVNGNTYHTYWELASNGTYDMSVYKDSFRGIGAIYRTGDGCGATFHGNLNGNNSTVTYELNRIVKGDEQWAYKQNLNRVGLFNSLYGSVIHTSNMDIYNELKDFAGVDGMAVERPCYVIKDLNVGGSIEVEGEKSHAGGVVGEIVTGNFAFKNIGTIQNAPLKIGISNKTTISDFGGIVGKIRTNSSYVLVEDCHWQGTTASKITMNGYYQGGGLVGNSTASILKIKDCSMEYLTLTSARENAGGLLGWTNDDAGKLIVIGSEEKSDGLVTSSTPVSVKNCSITSNYDNGTGEVGGVIGESRCTTEIYNALSEDNTLRSLKSMGGIIGELAYNYNVKTSSVENVTVTDLVINENSSWLQHLAGIGGVVGASTHILSIQDVEVSGDKDENGTESRKDYSCQIAGNSNKSRTGNTGIGGIIGVQTTNALTLKNCGVTTVYFSGDATYVSNYPVFIGVGGLCGYNESSIVLKGNNSVSGCKIKTQLASESSNEVLAVGGCFGLVRASIGASADKIPTYYEGLSATENTVIGKYAGGLIGRLDGANGQVRLQAVQVTKGTVTSDETAGGLIGYAQPGGNGFAFNGAGVTSADKVNLISDMTITGRAAGGVYGYYNQVGPSARSENLMIQNSQIIATATNEATMRSAGGFIGESKLASHDCRIFSAILKNCMVVAETSSENRSSIATLSNYAAGGILGRMVTDSKNGDIRCDNIKIHTDNRIGVRVKNDASDAAVKLVMKDGTLVSSVVKPTVSSLTNGLVVDPDTGLAVKPKNYDALESLVKDYGYCVGTFVGTMDSVASQFYVMCSNDVAEEFTIPVLEYNSPVTDVGVSAATQLDEEDASYYRKGAHIIYGAPVTERDGYMASDPFKNVAYINERVEETGANYTDEMTLATLLKYYRFSPEAVELFENSYAETYSFPGSTNTVKSILVYKPQNGTIQEVMETLTDVMTNVAGASASDMKILEITCTQKLINGDTTTDGDNPSITAKVTDGVAEYTYVHEDGLVGNERAMSYTELTYTYTCENGHRKIFSLPIFIEEPVYYGVHMKILEDNVTSVSDIMQNGLLASDDGTRIVIANDSDYTLLMEYAYGKARKKMPEEVAAEKSFILKASEGVKELPIGTKLRLIDVTHGNMPYYYTVESTGITEVKFSDFKDSAGEHYVNQPIRTLPSEGEEAEDDPDTIVYTDLAGHTLTNTGVERYLLTVFNVETDNMAYQIHTDMVPQILKEGIEDTDASKNAKTQFSPFEEHEKMPWFFVTAVPGLEISLVKTDNQTDIDGKITKEESLTVKATILLHGEDMYWAYMDEDGLDSENSGKFLEIALYLRDEGRVNLPEGTNISFVTGVDGEGNKIYSENKVIQDNTVLYYYKDIEEIEKSIDAILAGANKQDVTIDLEYVLNFAGADLSEFTSGSYEACIELLRTADSKYPMGSGNTLDIYSETVQAQAANNLGFAIKSKKLEQLAINTYPTANPDGNKIDYQTMFDFSDILEKISGVGEEEALERWAGFDYEVTYTLYQKQKQTMDGVETISYVKYTGDDIAVSVEGAESTKQRAFATDGYVGVTATYRFGADEIKKGTSVEGAVQQDGLVIREGSMELATANLVSASQDNLTNYKIIATMKIIDSSSSNEGENASADSELTTEDFFVFTVTKLKTDLSE